MRQWILSKLKMSKPKVIVIAGTTGVGKSQLSIQIASHFAGEVINSDSMQVYKDIPIITNKHPINERNGVPHHVMNHVNWDEEYYLHRFENDCKNAIKDIHSRGKIPVIVGGTHYYLQTLLQKRIEVKSRIPSTEELALLNEVDAEKLFSTLQDLDPEIAAKYHPKDTRRVRRMLEIYYTTGKKPSETFAAQKQLLIYDTLFLWLYSSPEALDKRLDDRVDAMMDLGALEEIKQLHQYYKTSSLGPETCENGVWQVIGFKEFLPWLEGAKDSSFEVSVERMKTRTRQYAKKQVKWIKKMLLPDVSDHLYALDATDLEKWDENVSQRALSLVSDFVSGNSIQAERFPQNLKDLTNTNIKDSNSPKLQDDWERYTCVFCRDKKNVPLIAIGERSWNIHLQSRRHRTNLSRLKKQEKYRSWQEANSSSEQ